MSHLLPARNLSVIREEIEDLSHYLDGLPEKLKAGGAFVSYEKRLIQLHREYFSNFHNSSRELVERLKSTPSVDDKIRLETIKHLEQLAG